MVAYAVAGEVGLTDIENLCADAVETAGIEEAEAYTVTCYFGDPGEVPDMLPIHEQDQLHAALRDGADRIIIIAVEEGCEGEVDDDDDE